MTSHHLGPWRPLSVDRLAGVFATARFSWWVGGGWALDLFIGRQTRPHGDLDVAVLRHDQHAVFSHLAGLGWDLHVAAGGVLRPWRGEDWLGPGDNDVWCRLARGRPWALQLNLTDSDGDDWVFRRNPHVRRPLAELGHCTSGGLAYLRPEVILLFKAKEPRPKDEADFRLALPLLDQPARRWLHASLSVTHPGHPWLAVLASEPG